MFQGIVTCNLPGGGFHKMLFVRKLGQPELACIVVEQSHCAKSKPAMPPSHTTPDAVKLTYPSKPLTTNHFSSAQPRAGQKIAGVANCKREGTDACGQDN